jgi:hypothetical protein
MPETVRGEVVGQLRGFEGHRTGPLNLGTLGQADATAPVITGICH